MRLAAHGIEIELPRGWEGRIFRRAGADPMLHAASFELPAHDGDFGSGATARIPAGGAFLALKEYRPGPRLVPDAGLFAPSDIPLPLGPDQFHPRVLQVGRPGQAGFQHFFTAKGRPFCVYAVVKAAPARARTAGHVEARLGAVNDVLASLRFPATR
jgi:hypothetical protein